MTQRLLNCGIILGALVVVMAHEVSPVTSQAAAVAMVMFAMAALVVRP